MNDTISILSERKKLMIDYLKLRLDLSDWHGVMDASADIREIEAQISILNKVIDAGSSTRKESSELSTMRDKKTITANGS